MKRLLLFSLMASSLAAQTTVMNGNFSPRSVANIRYVDAGNPLGWGGTDACGWINSAIASLPTTGGFPVGVVDFSGLASTSSVACGTTVSAGSPYLTLRGPGSGALTFNCTMVGDCFNTQEGANFLIATGFRISGFTLLGQASTNANAVGLHAGDMVGGRFEDIAIDNFLGTNSSCMQFDNVNGFFERNVIMNVELGIHGATQSGCTKALRVTANGGSTISFGRTRVVASSITVGAGTIGVSLENTIFWYEGTLEISGNMVGNGGTVLAMSGSANLFNDRMDMGFECTQTCSSATLLSAAGTSTMSWVQGRLTGGTGFTNSITTTMPIRMNYGSFDQSTGDTLNASAITFYNNQGATFGVTLLPQPGAPSFLSGLFDNIVYNNTNFVTATDLTNNGGEYVGGGHNGQMYFGIVPTASPSTGQTITPANIKNFIQATINPPYFNIKPALDLVERAAPACVVGDDVVWGDSTHYLRACTNGSNIHKVALTESGSCAMSSGLTCTFTASAAFNSTPFSFASIDAASTVPATANSAKCSISGTTVTITAGISNSLTWDCLLVGNPN